MIRTNRLSTSALGAKRRSPGSPGKQKKKEKKEKKKEKEKEKEKESAAPSRQWEEGTIRAIKTGTKGAWVLPTPGDELGQQKRLDFQTITAEHAGRVFSGLEYFGYLLTLSHLLSGKLEGTGVIGDRLNLPESKRESRQGDARAERIKLLKKLPYGRQADALDDMVFFDRMKPIVRRILRAVVPREMRVS